MDFAGLEIEQLTVGKLLVLNFKSRQCSQLSEDRTEIELLAKSERHFPHVHSHCLHSLPEQYLKMSFLNTVIYCNIALIGGLYHSQFQYAGTPLSSRQ